MYSIVMVMGYQKVAIETGLSFLWQTTQRKYGTCISVFFRIKIWRYILNLQEVSMIFGKGVRHFPIGILGQVWYLIVSIPDLCTLTYFHNYIGMYICVGIRADFISFFLSIP